jgi:histone H3/H4
MPKRPFQRLVRQIVSSTTGRKDCRMTKGSLECLQTAAEQYLVDLFGTTQLVTLAAGRREITPSDMQLVQHIQGDEYTASVCSAAEEEDEAKDEDVNDGGGDCTSSPAQKLWEKTVPFSQNTPVPPIPAKALLRVEKELKRAPTVFTQGESYYFSPPPKALGERESGYSQCQKRVGVGPREITDFPRSQPTKGLAMEGERLGKEVVSAPPAPEPVQKQKEKRNVLETPSVPSSLFGLIGDPPLPHRTSSGGVQIASPLSRPTSLAPVFALHQKEAAKGTKEKAHLGPLVHPPLCLL